MNDDQRLHGHLVGQDDARAHLNTPVLCLDLDRLETNILTMARACAAAGVRLKPHAKTHKSLDIARRQLAAGAAGQCCAKLGEAEALAQGGVSGLHITSPVVSRPGLGRLAALNQTSQDLSVVCDHPDNAVALSEAVQAQSGPRLSVFVDLDPGLGRTGVASLEAAVGLAGVIARSPGLRFAGVQMYCGREQHVAGFAERREALTAHAARLADLLQALRRAGLPAEVVTGGGTGSYQLDFEFGLLTELQAGSYAFMDDQYEACDLDGTGRPPFLRSLFVEAQVVSVNARGMVTLDAGLKAFSTDAQPPVPVWGAPPGARFAFMGDEHGALVAADAPKLMRLGDRVRLSVPHCDPTVNLYDSYHVLRGDRLVAIWPVSARGRSR